MRTSKKILSVFVALMMLLSVVALGAYAMPADTVVELTIAADKTAYAAGDDITLTVYGQSNDETTLEMAGQYILGYDSSAIEPYSTSTDLDSHGFAAGAKHTSGYDPQGSQVVFDDILVDGGMTTRSNGSAVIGYFIAESSDTFDADSQAGPVELFSVKMKVKADAADGDYEIAFNADSFADYNCYVVDSFANGCYGTSGPDFGFTANNMFSLGSVTIHVGATGPKVAFSKASAKLVVKDGALDTTEGVKNVQMMVKSVITDADFDTYFFNTKTVGNADTAANENKIKDVGIVAFKGAAANFDEETAKGVVAGTAAANYEAARTDYISKASDSADAYFGAVIKGTWEGTFKNNDIVFLGFVEYYDAAGDVQVIFYETSVTKTITQSWVDANISNF
jgi:hypothetical protein